MRSWIRAGLIGACSGVAASLVVLALEQLGLRQPLGSQPALVIGLLSAFVVGADLLRHRQH